MSGFMDIFQNIPAQATAVGLATALIPIAGSMPSVNNMGSYFTITFTPEQSDRVSQFILAQLNKEPGSVRMDVSSIAWQVILREYWMYFAGAIALGCLLSKLTGRRG
jgi:hypothetical protein